jgi:hypothetical protein
MDPTVQPNPIVVGYSKNDFFWTSASADMLKTCPASQPTDCSGYTSDCYKYEVCKNKEYSDWFLNTQANHSGADGRYLDTRKVYNFSLQKTINLTAAIIGVCVYIYYNK